MIKEGKKYEEKKNEPIKINERLSIERMNVSCHKVCTTNLTVHD